jgi:hypothetical protein
MQAKLSTVCVRNLTQAADVNPFPPFSQSPDAVSGVSHVYDGHGSRDVLPVSPLGRWEGYLPELRLPHIALGAAEVRGEQENGGVDLHHFSAAAADVPL